MNSRQPARTPAPVLLAALLLVLFSATGLLAGTLTRVVAAGQGLRPIIIVTNSDHTSTATATSTPSPTPTVTSIPTQTITGPFTLSESVTPNIVSPGDRMTVSVVASDGQGNPVEGLACNIGAPHGGTSLFSVLPSPAVTNNAGVATWTLTVPANTLPGEYDVRVYADGTSYHADQVRSINVK